MYIVAKPEVGGKRRRKPEEGGEEWHINPDKVDIVYSWDRIIRNEPSSSRNEGSHQGGP